MGDGQLRRVIGRLGRGLRRVAFRIAPADWVARLLHPLARRYWERADDTFVAPSSYYDDVEAAVADHVCPRLAREMRLLDVGCGNGRFTLQLAQHCGQATAFDLSVQLIAEARRAAADAGITNATFEVRDAETMAPDRTFDVVVCMGVLVCMVDDALFTSFLRSLAGSVDPGGLLVLRESLDTRRTVEWNKSGYVGCYRPRAQYEEILRSCGLELEEDVELVTWSPTRVNHLLLFRRPPSES